MCIRPIFNRWMNMLHSRYLALSLLLLLPACRSAEKPPPPAPVTVTDFIVEKKNVPAVFEFVGFAQSPHPVEIRARVEGYLDEIAYEEGQLVHEGDLLFQLDPRQYEAQVAQAKAEVAKQKAILENAILTVDRLAPLYEQKAASKKDLDNAIASQLAAAAQLEAAKAQLLNNEINLGYTTIVSPITGYSERARFREGALINPGGNSLMTTVSTLNPIWVYFSISDNDILRSQQQEAEDRLSLPTGKNLITLPPKNAWRVEAVLSDGSILKEEGTIDFSSPVYDQATGSMFARAVFPNPDGIIRPGQFVRVRLLGAERPNALYVPQRSLVTKKGGQMVYLITKDDKVVAQDVSTGAWFDQFQIVTNGLKPGDRIVVDGINKIRPNSTVQITGEWKPSSTPPPTSASTE